MRYCGAAGVACIVLALAHKPVDTECSDDPPYTLPPSIRSRTVAVGDWQALAWLNPERYPTLQGFNILEVENLAELLVSIRFEAIELKILPRNKHEYDWQSKTLFLDPTVTSDWVRVSIQNAGHPLCKGFDTAAKKGRFSMERVVKKGFSPNKCIAVEPIATPRSEFALDIVRREDSTPSEGRYLWKVLDMKSQTTYAEILRHVGSGKDCPSREVRGKFANVVQP
jgi:hypothetical protein